jgi:hypothetical protein
MLQEMVKMFPISLGTFLSPAHAAAVLRIYWTLQAVFSEFFFHVRIGPIYFKVNYLCALTKHHAMKV